MQNIITKVHSGPLSGDVFYGSAEVVLGNRTRHTFNVCKIMREGVDTKFRAVTKVKAGWNTIIDFTCKPENLWHQIGKHTICVQALSEHGVWHDVYATKGGLWANIDVILLEKATVGDIHSFAPKMACYETWNRANAKTWADKAFVQNP